MEELSNNKINYSESKKCQYLQNFLVVNKEIPHKIKKNNRTNIFKIVLKNNIIIFTILIIPIILVSYKIIKKGMKNVFNKYTHIQKRIIIKNQIIPKKDSNDTIIIHKTIDKIIINNNTNSTGDQTLDLKALTNYISLNKNEEIENGKKFFELCMSKELLNKTKILKKENPLISVVIPLYNTEDKLWASVRSIQNQNITNFEIILVNDASNTKTCEVITKIQEEEPRILLINNKKNMGTLYSRCIGALKSNGKYIFPLDHDDLFFDEGILDLVSSMAEKGNFDIVEFKGAERYSFNIFTNKFKDSEYSNHDNNLILFQPELGKYARRKNNIFGIYDCFLWAKCIKSDVYKKTINSMGEEIYLNRIFWGEDLITSFVLFKIAKSFKFISKYGISRFKSMSTISNKTPTQMFHLSKLIYLKVLLDFTENNFYDKYLLVHEAISTLRVWRRYNSDNKKYADKILNLIMENKYINNLDKHKIKLYTGYNRRY